MNLTELELIWRGNTMITIQILNKENQVLYSQTDMLEVTLGGYRNCYNEGDQIKLICDKDNMLLKISLDQCLSESIVYLKDYEYIFKIPFQDERKPYGDNAFVGERHWGYVVAVSNNEIGNYIKLSQNSSDMKINKTLFPHVTTNVATQNPQFYARNTIDGIFETSNHGSWPHSSWGINQQSDAWLKVDFGRYVHIKQIQIFLRADFPHDNYWVAGEIEISNREKILANFSKTGRAQIIDVDIKNVRWIKLKNLIISKEPSQFPALSQIVVYGYNE